MMNALERIHACGVVPVVVLDRAEDAVPTAHALLEGGVNVMEITFRTAAAEESIRRVAESCPEMLVGAGTAISLFGQSQLPPTAQTNGLSTYSARLLASTPPVGMNFTLPNGAASAFIAFTPP